MILRIRLPKGRRIERRDGKNRHIALALAALLAPLALMAYVLGLWRLASDLGLTGEFPITGLLSHWQVWILAGAALHLCASALNRYGLGAGFHVPRVLNFHPRPAKHKADRKPASAPSK